MKKFLCLILTIVAALVPSFAVAADDRSVPRFVRFNGTLAAYPDQVVAVSFRIYGEAQGGAALWSEEQSVPVDANGRYAILLGSTTSDGLPSELFATNEARWLGVQVLANAEPEQARVLLVSVPYALKARDADTLGGRPLGEFVLQSSLERRLAELDRSSSSKETGTKTTSAASSLIGAYGASFTDPTFATGYKWLELTTQSTAGKYNGTLNSFPQPGDPLQNNWSMRLGYNILSGGGRENESLPAIALEWESNFSPQPGISAQEFHLAHVDSVGFVRRPITYYKPNVGKDALGLNVSVLQLGDASAKIKAYFGQNGQYDWYMGADAPPNTPVYLLRANNNGISTGSFNFQQHNTLPFWNLGGFRTAAQWGQTALGTVNPQPFTMLYIPVAPLRNGIDIVGTTNYYISARQGGGHLFLVDAAGSVQTVGTVTANSGFIGNLTGTASKATAFATDPADCLTGRFATAIASNGDLTCAPIQASDVPNLSNTYVDLTSAQIIAGSKTFTGPVATVAPLTTGQSSSVQQTIPFTASPTFNAGAGNNFKMTLTDSVTSSNLSDAVAGQTMVFLLCQDGTGGRTFAWPTNFKSAMVVGAGANQCSTQQFYFDGSVAYALTAGIVHP